jgi:hypothetical protein
MTATDYSCLRFLAPDIEETLNRVLLDLAGDISKILDCPGIPPHARLSGIAARVDEQAPAPDPEDGSYESLRPRPGSSAELLIDLVTSVRALLVHTGLTAQGKLDQITGVLVDCLVRQGQLLTLA